MEVSIERIEGLEKKVAELEKLIVTLISKETTKSNVETIGYADIYQYKNSLLLTSKSKEYGTYAIKDSLKQIGAKWATVTDKNGTKLSGWMILGICKEYDMDVAINSIVDKLAELKCTLTFVNKGKIDPPEVAITTQ